MKIIKKRQSTRVRYAFSSAFSCSFAACMLAWGGAALAQSSVTLYGVVDLGLQYSKSGSSTLTRLQDEGWQQSRIGLRGNEDLGGGLSAFFTLEGGILADVGQGVATGGGLNFNRQSYLGIGTPWGRISAGRVYTPMFVAVYLGDPLEVNAIYSSSMLMYATDAQPGIAAFATRANNMVQWKSPANQPWYANVGYGFGEAASPGRNNGRVLSGAFGWQQKPYTLLYSIQKVTGGSAANPVPNPTQTQNQAVTAAWNVNDDIRLMGAYMVNELKNSATPVGDAKIWMGGADWKLAPMQRLIFTVAQRKVDDSPRKQTTWSAGYDYSLSKRTIAYTRFRHLKNAGNASETIFRVPIVADSGDNVRSFAIGLRHSF